MKRPTLTQYLMEHLHFSSAFMRNTHFSEKYVESKLKIIKFLFWWVNVHENRMKLMQVIAVNIIESCVTFISFISYYINMHFFKKYVRLKIIKFSLYNYMIEEINKNHSKQNITTCKSVQIPLLMRIFFLMVQFILTIYCNHFNSNEMKKKQVL